MIYIFKHKQTGNVLYTRQVKTLEDATKQLNIEVIENYDYGTAEIYESRYFDISPDHAVTFWDLDRKVLEGVYIPHPTNKVVNNKIIKKTAEELFAENLISQTQYNQLVYDEKVKKHKGYRFYLYCDYDLLFTTSLTHPDLKATIDYLLPRKGSEVIDFTISDAYDEQDNHFNKAEIFASRIAESELSIFSKYSGENAEIEIFKGFEDLNDFIVN